MPEPQDLELVAIDLNAELFRGDLRLLADHIVAELYQDATATRLLLRKARNATEPGTPAREGVNQAWIRYLRAAVALKEAWLRDPDPDSYGRLQGDRLLEMRAARRDIESLAGAPAHT